MSLTDRQLQSYIEILRQGGKKELFRHLTDVCEYSKEEARTIIDMCHEQV